VERLLLTAEETAEMLGIGRTKVYELMRLGLIESVKIRVASRVRWKSETGVGSQQS
jgi:excisionase family DNA binding protein